MSYQITNIYGPEIEQDWQNETTRYWFELDVDGESEQYCIADQNGDTRILDANGIPLTEGDGLEIKIRRALEPLYEKARDSRSVSLSGTAKYGADDMTITDITTKADLRAHVEDAFSSHPPSDATLDSITDELWADAHEHGYRSSHDWSDYLASVDLIGMAASEEGTHEEGQ